ncbi:MAG: hypothetical protein ACYCOU_10515 [Sulfobacillus sp.]
MKKKRLINTTWQYGVVVGFETDGAETRRGVTVAKIASKWAPDTLSLLMSQASFLELRVSKDIPTKPDEYISNFNNFKKRVLELYNRQL